MTSDSASPQEERPAWVQMAQGTLLELAETARFEFPDRTFLIFGNGPSWTYSKFADAVDAFALGLAELGVGRGDRVCSLLDNGPEAVQTWFATLVLGAIYVPLNTANRGEFLRHVIDDAEPAVIVCELDLLDRVGAIESELNCKPIVVYCGENIGGVHLSGRTERFADLCRRGAALDWYEARPGDVASLVYTSGTTGLSKGCMMSHNYLRCLAKAVIQGRTPEEVAYTPLPLFHASGVGTVLSTLLIGGTAMIARRFSVSGFWSDIEKSGAGFANLLGSMAALLAKAPETPEMRRCKGQLRLVNAAPFAPEVREVFKERFGVLEEARTGYGLTEAAVVTALPDGDEYRPGSSGKGAANLDVRIFDDDDREVAPGVVGEVVCRPRTPHVVFEGYWRRPEDTLRIFRNMWLHTGDLGSIDHDGYFYFADRKKDYLRRRGENISSMELEAAFMKHPDITEVAAYGVQSDLDEDDVQVTVILREGAVLSAEELCFWSVDQVPYFAVPRYIEIVADLPRTATGRVRKEELRSRPSGYDRWDRELSAVSFDRR